jgi:hypothetical protein
MAKYVVYVNAPPYPMRGYYLEARRLSIPEARGERDFRDTLPPDLVHVCGAAWVEVEATNVEEAKAIGLSKIMKCEEK